MLKAAIQFPIQKALSFEIVLDVFKQLGIRYVMGKARMEHPLSFRLVPMGDYFFGEIWVPLQGRVEVETALKLMTTINYIYKRAHPDEPSIYKAGLRYGLANKTAWYTTPILHGKKIGDCKDFACDRTADLWIAGEMGAKPFLKFVGNRQWHAQVERANGQIEDPSAKLGMWEYLRRQKE